MEQNTRRDRCNFYLFIFRNFIFNFQNKKKILLTHGPPEKYGGLVVGRNVDAGCKYLAKKIKQIKPLVHVCGILLFLFLL